MCRTVSYQTLMAGPLADNSTVKHVFLGNGFNLALGVDTSYQQMSKDLLEQHTIKLLLDNCMYGELKKKIEDFPGQMEIWIDQVQCPAHKAVIKEVLYRTILRRCQAQFKYKEAIAFLQHFTEFYTTNYDPLLYLALLSVTSKEEIIKTPFYKAIEAIHNRVVMTEEGKPRADLHPPTSKTRVYQIASEIFSQENKFTTTRKSEYYNAIKIIRGEGLLEKNDGLYIEPSKKEERKSLGWDDPSLSLLAGDKNYESKQTIFYLHGALHFYEAPEEPKTRKKIKIGSTSLLNQIITEKINPVCVFNHSSQKKEKHINNNSYLKYCSERLGQAEGDLYIIGWKCADNDAHLVKLINDNKKIDRLVISYYDIDTKSTFKKEFENKEKIFFDIKEADFCKGKKEDDDEVFG